MALARKRTNFHLSPSCEKLQHEMNNWWPVLPIRDCAGVTSFVVLTQEIKGPGKGFHGDWIGNEVERCLCGWPLLVPWSQRGWAGETGTIPREGLTLPVPTSDCRLRAISPQGPYQPAQLGYAGHRVMSWMGRGQRCCCFNRQGVRQQKPYVKPYVSMI